MKLLVSDISWKYINSRNLYQPVLKLLKEEETVEIELSNYRFNFILSEEKYCTGYSLEGQYHGCKNNVSGLSFYQYMCYDCDRSHGFRDAFFFGKEPNSSIQKYLEQKHLIYLAFFAPNIIKVGTSSESRKNLRLIEQDALIYAFIAESTGLTIQQLEHEISKKLGITETVKAKVKFKNIYNKPNYDIASKQILNEFDRIKGEFSNNRDYSDWLYDKKDIEIINNSSRNEIFYPAEEVHLLKDPQYLSGKFLGLRGKYLFLENNSNIVAFDTRSIEGRYIEDYEDNFIYEIQKEESDQMSMF
jgi:hypothetical protein